MKANELLTYLLAIAAILVPVIVTIIGFIRSDSSKLKLLILVSGILVVCMVGLVIAYVIEKPELDAIMTTPTATSTDETVGEIKDDRNAKITSILQEAEAFALDEDYENALSIINKGLNQFPDSPMLSIKKAEYEAILRDNAKRELKNKAANYANNGDYDTAMNLIENGEKLYGTDSEFTQLYREYQKADIISDVMVLNEKGDLLGALKRIYEGQKVFPTDIDLIEAASEQEKRYVEYVLLSIDECLELDKHQEAMALVDEGLAVLPDNNLLQERKQYLIDNEPILVTSQDVSEVHSPNDNATSVNLSGWEREKDMDINSVHYDGGVKVTMSNFYEAVGGTSSGNRVTSKVTITFGPANHTEKEFTGVIVLHNSMYGSKSYGTIRILVENEEVFTTGEIGGNTQKAFPFCVDITGVTTVVFEADVMLKASDFVYGIVRSK